MEIDKNKAVEKTVSDLCGILLVQEDYLNEQKMLEYIKSLSVQCRFLFSENSEGIKGLVRITVQNCIRTYIVSALSPFEFDVSNRFTNFQISFSKNYQELYSAVCPPNLLYIFELIKSASESYSIFEQAYEIKKSAIIESVKSFATEATKSTLTEKEKEIKEKIDSAIETATNTVQNTTDAVSEDLRSKTSETSITILGIFSAIVLVANTFLAFSDITIETFISGNPYRSLFTVLVIGFMFGNILIALISILKGKRKTDISTHQNITGNDTAKICAIMYNLVLSILLIALLFSWWFGLIEKRNTRINSYTTTNQSVQTNISP